MFTKNLIEYMKRHHALASKVADGTASDDDKAELDKLSNALKAASGEYEPQCKTELVALSADEAKKYIETETAEAEASMDPDRLALLKRNLAEIKRQKDAGAEVFAIQRPVAKADGDVSALSARMDKLESKLDELFAKLSQKDEASEETEETEETTDGEADEAEVSEGAKGDEEEHADEEKAEESKETEEAEEAEAKTEETEEKGEEDVEAVAWGDLSAEAVSEKAHGASDTYQALKKACGRRRA